MKFLLVLRHYAVGIIAAFLLCFGAYGAYAYFNAHDHLATANVMLQMPSSASAVKMQTEPASVRAQILASSGLEQKVEARLKPDLRESLIKPLGHGSAGGSDQTLVQILQERSHIEPGSASQMVDISFRHPDPEIAATVANLFTDEFLAADAQLNKDRVEQATQQLKNNVDQQHTVTQQAESKVADIVTKYGLANLDERGSVIIESALVDLSKNVQQKKLILDDATGRMQSVQKQVDDKKPLWELRFIAEQGRVASLFKTFSAQNTKLAELETTYQTPDYPDVVAQKALVTETATELSQASESAARMVNNDLIEGQNNYNEAVKQLQAKQQEEQEMSQAHLQYVALRKDQDTQESLYQSLLTSLQQESEKTKLSMPSYQIVDHADSNRAPLVYPTLIEIAPIGTAAGLAGGLITALGLMFFRPPPPTPEPRRRDYADEFRRRRSSEHNSERREHRGGERHGEDRSDHRGRDRSEHRGEHRDEPGGSSGRGRGDHRSGGDHRGGEQRGDGEHRSHRRR